MISSASGAPANLAELWEHYHLFVIRQVRSMGIPEAEVEDVASEILVRFIEKGMLEQYDPERLWDIQDIPGRPSRAILPGERHRPAKFGSFLRRFVFLYSLQWRDKLNRRRTREGTSLAALGEDHVAPDTAAWDELDEQGAGLASDCVFEGLVAAALDEHPTWDLALALSLCHESVTEKGRVDRGFLAAGMGVSKSAAPKVIAALREVLIAAGATEALRNVA